MNNSSKVLPQPDAESKQRSQSLVQCIKSACVEAGGWIGFSEYMNIVLYQPGLGYYSGGLQKFGHRGDFVTAPEVSPLFGQCLAGQIYEVLKTYQKTSGGSTHVLEFGAGSGVLAADILLMLDDLGLLPAQYFILELSAELKRRQKETIKKKVPHLYNYVLWLDQLPDDINNVIIIANEVLDAMPVECFRVSTKADKNAVEYLMVGFEENNLVSRYKAADGNTVDMITRLESRSEIVFPDNYCSEYNPAIKGWLSALDSKIKNQVILLIDYGYNEKEYYHPDRNNGTLMCYYQHRAHDDFFWWPGLQDITAFVDFTDIAYSAVELGLEVAGYTTQAAFLLANGLSELHASQVSDDVQQQIRLSQQIKTLTLPSEMGDRFKVMALTKNYDEPLTGFSMLDLRNRL